VTDHATKVTWQRNVESGSSSWAGVKAYCDALTLDGGGWRLPSVKELLAIIDLCRKAPAFDPAIFPGTPNELFWSSTAMVANPSQAWFVYFGEGNADSHDVDTMSLARCAR
jgi:hypothetical protein